MPPLELPKHKTKSAIRDHGGNEIIMEGQGGTQRITMFSPHAGTKLNLGAANSPAPGFALSTDANWEAFVGGFEDVKIGKKSHRELGADASEHIVGTWNQVVDGDTSIKGGFNLTELFLGFKHDTVVVSRSELTLGSKNESTVGLLSEMCGGIKVDIHKGKHFTHQPDEIAMTSAARVHKAEEEMEKFAEHLEIVGKLHQKFGAVQAQIDTLTEQVKGAMKINAQLIELAGDDLLKLQSGEIMLDSSGLLKLIASDLKFAGNLNANDGALTCSK
jgi:hypothetical protein